MTLFVVMEPVYMRSAITLSALAAAAPFLILKTRRVQGAPAHSRTVFGVLATVEGEV